MNKWFNPKKENLKVLHLYFLKLVDRKEFVYEQKGQ